MQDRRTMRSRGLPRHVGPRPDPHARPIVFAVAALLAGASAAPAAPQAAGWNAPAAFGVADRAAILVVHGVGAQVYECKADAGGAMRWTFREPIATLVRDGATIGHHYAGPTWELVDGDRVRGRQSAMEPGATPDDAPLLKLEVVEHRGDGVLKDAKLVLRLNTEGGVLKGGCAKAGELRAAPYSADYAFLR
ncbi:MAG TPA: DUF3455 domain-containing protein [Caulobacteraceae bacterium]|jgi:hypothetical protein|nr:DUF3455 domain-containing protein [Caulobacteraceae bacterium]